MITSGIALIIASLIIFLLSVLTYCDKKYTLTIWLFIIATFSCSWGISCIVDKFKSQEQKIDCSEIKQIDTLYKNDSIIGYEIIIMK